MNEDFFMLYIYLLHGMNFKRDIKINRNTYRKLHFWRKWNILAPPNSSHNEILNNIKDVIERLSIV